jgi:hypothetical protein
MSPLQRVRAVALIVLHLGTAAVAMERLVRRPANRVPGRKWMWALVIALNIGAGTVFRVGRLAAPTPGPGTVAEEDLDLAGVVLGA